MVSFLTDFFDFFFVNMRCCVKNCGNNSVNKGEDITFHNFPNDKILCEEWIKIVGHINTDSIHKVICSDHFRDEDYCIRYGARELRNGAVPFCDQKTPIEALQVCRVCLARNIKMDSIHKNKLDGMYQKLTGIDVHENENYPQNICWECAARLKSSVSFKQKALRAEAILKRILDDKKQMTENDIKSVNRRNMKFKSTLIQAYLEPAEFIEPNEKTLLLRKRSKEREELIGITNKPHDEESDQKGSSDESSEVVLMTKRRKVSKDKLVDGKIENMEKENVKALQDSEDVACSLMDRYHSAGKSANLAPLDGKIFVETEMSLEKQILEVQTRKDSESYKSAQYKCDVCFLVMEDSVHLAIHMKKHSIHTSGEFLCLICKVRRKTFKGLRDHINNQHMKRYTCKLCPFVTKIRSVARQHQNNHKGSTYQCLQCPAQFVTETSYLSHQRVKHMSSFVCELCGYTFVSEIGVAVHKKKKHDSDSQVLHGPHCDVCDLTFISEEAFARHLKLSTKHASDSDQLTYKKAQDVACDQCGYSFINYRGLALHRRVVHTDEMVEVPPDGPYCAECDVRFVNEEALKVHLKAAEKHRTSKSKEETPNHRRTLEQEDRKPVDCKECGLQLKDLFSYKFHYRTTHKENNHRKKKKPFVCEDCGRGFLNIYKLRDHRWLHADETPFKCEFCGKMFNTKSILTTHKLLHSENKPVYDCSLCSKSFSTASNRLKHMYIHSGIKPYKCDICEKSFKLPSERKTHIQHAHLKVPWPRSRKKKPPKEQKKDEKTKSKNEVAVNNFEEAMKNDGVENYKVVIVAVKSDEVAIKSDVDSKYKCKTEKNNHENDVFLCDDRDERDDEHSGSAEVTRYGDSNNEVILGDNGGEEYYEQYEALDDDFDPLFDNDNTKHHVAAIDELQMLDDEDY